MTSNYCPQKTPNCLAVCLKHFLRPTKECHFCFLVERTAVVQFSFPTPRKILSKNLSLQSKHARVWLQIFQIAAEYTLLPSHHFLESTLNHFQKCHLTTDLGSTNSGGDQNFWISTIHLVPVAVLSPTDTCTALCTLEHSGCLRHLNVFGILVTRNAALATDNIA